MISRNRALMAPIAFIFAANLLAARAANGQDGTRHLRLVAHICAAPSEHIADHERPFLTENMRAMDRMMKRMVVQPTGDIDVDFAAVMIPHHLGAIDMAVLELRYGHNEQLRRIAQEIIVDQEQEIAAMKLALHKPPPALIPVPTQSGTPLVSSRAAATHSRKGSIQ